MARIARRDNVRAIRPGLPIPPQREEDITCSIYARLAASYMENAYQLAQTEPNSKDHRMALHMARIAEQLPRNNLRVIVTPTTPREEWFAEAWRKVRIAQAACDLIESQHSLALHLDRFDEGGRAKLLNAERTEKRDALDLAILDALRTPVTRKGDIARKQAMVGKREWAAKYRPEWQAIIDEELARFPARSPRKREGR